MLALKQEQRAVARAKQEQETTDRIVLEQSKRFAKLVFTAIYEGAIKEVRQSRTQLTKEGDQLGDILNSEMEKLQ